MKKFKLDFTKKQKVIIAVSVAVLVGMGTTVSLYNKQIHAQQLAMEEKKRAEEYEEQRYQEILVKSQKAVQAAFFSRSDKDIAKAEEAVAKLKKEDQDSPKKRLTQLAGFLTQIKKTDQLISVAEKTKKESDVTAAQKSIDEEKDVYLEKDKKAHQTRLDKLKKTIASDKERSDKEKKDKEAAEKAAKEEKSTEVASGGNEVKEEVAAAQEQEQVEAAATPAAEEVPATDNGGYVPEQPAGGGVVNTPSQPQPSNPQPQQPAPTPNPPGNNGGGQPTPPPTPSEPTPDYEPAGRISPWFMTYAEALAWADTLPDDQFDRSGIAGTSFSDGSTRYCVVLR